MNVCVDNNKGVWLRRNYLKGKGVSENTIKKWCNRKIVICKKDSNHTYILYDTIPTPTRKKLPDKAMLLYDFKQEQAGGLQQHFFSQLSEAYNAPRSGHWRNEILKAHGTFEQIKFGEKVNEFARKAAVFERILSIYGGKKRELEPLYRAYDQLFPGNFSKKNRFCMVIKQAKEKGILSVAVNGSCLNRKKEKHGALHKYFACFILSHPKGFELTESHRKLAGACESANIDTPSLKWLWTYRKNNRNDIELYRLGPSKWEAKNGIRTTTIPACYAGDTWEIDGWEIPIYYRRERKDGKIDRFAKAVLFTVMDSHSQKIIGWRIAESENTETILKGLEKAVRETGTLPYEIVSDNHSFNKTKEAGHFKEDVASLGVIWNVDMNPRRKSNLERTFRTLGDKHFKNQFGYTGQGIRSVTETGVTQPELMDEYLKSENAQDFSQIVVTTMAMIKDYNNSTVKTYKDTPHNRYEESERPNAKPVDDARRVRLFIRKTEHTIRNNQVTITRGEHKFEYQLNAEYFFEYNNKKVAVRYENFDKIYLYNIETDEPVCCVSQKAPVHRSAANQTESDRIILNKHAGRRKGIMVQSRKRREEILAQAEALNKSAYHIVNKLTTPKDVIEEIKKDTVLSLECIEEYGFNIDSVRKIPFVDKSIDPALKPKKEKENRSPFYSGEGTMKVLETLDINN